mmetsp:Transcript_21154/g.54162  ORF Transcript_21154/g.54162 Transcript_21154/m.54162 type:complete len:92 (-) Transcript_21154:154-429(-)
MAAQPVLRCSRPFPRPFAQVPFPPAPPPPLRRPLVMSATVLACTASTAIRVPSSSVGCFAFETLSADAEAGVLAVHGSRGPSIGRRPCLAT